MAEQLGQKLGIYCAEQAFHLAAPLRPAGGGIDDVEVQSRRNLVKEDNGFRWTDGNALLPAASFGGVNGGATRYPLFGGPLRAAVA